MDDTVRVVPDAAVVLVHGFLGFGETRLPGLRLGYFRGVRTALRREGIEAWTPALPSRAGIAERARALAAFLDTLPHRRLVLIGHSMGGLDCRYVAARLDPKHRIDTVISLATPHRGSALADWGLKTWYPLAVLGRTVAPAGLRDLTTAAAARFNDEIRDRADVCYQSWAAAREHHAMPWLMRRWQRVVARSEGANDCEVSVASARWGEFRGTLHCDHLELVGWSLGFPGKKTQRPFDHVSFFVSIVKEALTQQEMVPGENPRRAVRHTDSAPAG